MKIRGGNVPIFELLFGIPSSLSPPFASLFSIFLGDMIRYPSRDVYPYPRDNSTALLDALRNFAALNCVFSRFAPLLALGRSLVPPM